jgi:phage terminase small subunit
MRKTGNEPGVDEMKKSMKKKPAKKKSTKPRKLTKKELTFAKEYIVDKNGAAAAVRAGYSTRAAKQAAYSLMKKQIMRNEINRLIEEQSKRLELTADMVIEEIRKVAFSDVRALFCEDGSLKNPRELDDKISAAVSSVESLEEYAGTGADRVMVGYTKKVKLWDKVRSLEALGRHFKLFTDVVETRDGDFLQKMEEAANERKLKAQKK